MESVFLTSEPIIALIILAITVILILLGKQLENSYCSLVIIIYSIIFLVYHTIAIGNSIRGVNPQLYISTALDLLLLLLGFITYLWVDNIVAKKKNLKSYGDPLEWFWDKKI